ncbi:hypothetical protein [Photobacterium sanguinicancri]|uniref:DUF805 domain-containing protein n=1 Tax=Photobacterium sanguinicancri TaxID=875932 RepID=A0AAW7Y4T1_9GAMM|nr:hypothetical protein [Photobacterium sanguinicancri]MDO6542338.1 hypothetical protein [Photobacterium sanguinicancri]
MLCSKPFPGQTDHIFKDKFNKWPKLFRAFVLLSLLPPALVMLLVSQQLAPLNALIDTVTLTCGFNIMLIAWGVLLKVRARKYWYRNYHIGKTLVLACLPFIASAYIALSDIPDNRVVQQERSQAVEVAIN